jgi:hypothetical protein
MERAVPGEATCAPQFGHWKADLGSSIGLRTFYIREVGVASRPLLFRDSEPQLLTGCLKRVDVAED